MDTTYGQSFDRHNTLESREVDAYDSSEEPHSLQSEYSMDEVTQLIRIALERAKAAEDRSVTAEELLAIGNDLGLSEEDILAASEEVHEQRADVQRAALAMQHVKIHAAGYVAIVFGLFVVNMLTSTDFLWFLMPTFLYAPFVVVHAYMAKLHPRTAVALFDEEDRDYS